MFIIKFPLGLSKPTREKVDITKPRVIIIVPIVNKLLILACESMNKATLVDWHYCYGCKIFLNIFCRLIMPSSSEQMIAKRMQIKLCIAHHLQLEDKTHWSHISSLSRHIPSTFLAKNSRVLSLMKTATAWHGIGHHKLISTPN